MTDQAQNTEPGYRGSLPPREDRLGRPWILLVIAIFVLILVLSFFGIPSRFIPEPTPVPLPSLPSEPASESAEPSASESASPEASESASASASPSASP